MPTHSRLRAASYALCIAAAAFASAARAAPADKDRPFQATLEISESVTFTGAMPCFAIGLVSGRGHGLHVGKVRATSRDCINPSGPFDPNGPTAYQFTSANGPEGLVFTAANGDQLFATYAGTMEPRPDGPHAVKGHFVITGGTGRFAGATGGGSFEGSEDISRVVIGEGEISLLGRIRY